MQDDSLWVFGYASLIWRPGFPCTDRLPAFVRDYRRDMCFLSVHYRGTPECPGLVCGLMEQVGAVCYGIAYRVAGADAAETIAYLDGRELISSIYLPKTVSVELSGGRVVQARTYVADTSHAQFVGHWDDLRKARTILQAVGSEGPAYDYLSNIITHLHGLAIADPHMDELWIQVEALKASSPSSS